MARLSAHDDEYLGAGRARWNVRPRGTSSAPVQAGSGAFTIDFAFPPPEPPPVTTIAWRLAHVIVGVFGARVAAHFGGPPTDYQSFDYAGTADAALSQLDEVYDAWTTACASWTPRRWPAGRTGRGTMVRAPDG